MEITSLARKEWISMKCPECGNEMKKGVIQVKDTGSITQFFTMVSWHPVDDTGKIVKRDRVGLPLKAEGYYCDECMKVYGIFEEKHELF